MQTVEREEEVEEVEEEVRRGGLEEEKGEPRTKDADVMVAMCSRILRWRDRLL